MYLFWVILYEIVYMGSTILPTRLSMGSWLAVLNVTLYFCILFWWLWRKKKVALIGLQMIKWRELRGCCFGIPLLALPIYNLWILQAYEFQITTFFLIMYSTLAEEIFFRGFLLEYLSRWKKNVQVLGSSLLFAVAHFVNLLSGNELSYICMQVLCAFVVGVCFALVRIENKSIIICVIVHLLINLTASGSLMTQGLGLWLCILVYVLYGLWLWNKSDNLRPVSSSIDNVQKA